MKTLLFTIEYPPFKGGVANYYINVAENWPEPNNFFVLNNEKDKLIRNKTMPKWLPAIFLLFKEIKRRKIEHILVGQILPLGTVAYLVTKFTKTSFSVFFHGMDFKYALKTKRKKWITKKILSQASNIICASNFTANLVKDFLGENDEGKVFTVNPGVDVRASYNKKLFTEIKERYNIENKFILFTVGRLVKRKGQDMAIKAIIKLTENLPNVWYYIGGDGPDKEYLKELAKNCNNIVFLGKISEEEKNLWLRSCDIFIMPNREIEGDFEGFGIVFLEAALAGKPVLAGRSGGIEDAVVDYETGILVDPDSVDDIVDGIIELKNKPMLRMELGENAMRRAVNEFLWNNQVSKIYNIINK